MPAQAGIQCIMTRRRHLLDIPQKEIKLVNLVNAVPLFPLFGVLDRNYYFGNLFYSVFAYMEEFFQYKDPSIGRRFARLLADPIKSLFFQKVERGDLDAKSIRKLYDLFTEEN